MRLKIPMTGTVLEYHPDWAAKDGQGIKGDPNDPVRLIPLNLGNVSWQLISIDLENDLMEIEVSPVESIDDNGQTRPTTAQEKQQLLDNARQSVESKTIDELYSITNSKRLIKLHLMKE